jgi:hypothetical protein
VVAFTEAISMDLQKRRFSEPKRMKMLRNAADKEKQMNDDTTADTTKLHALKQESQNLGQSFTQTM